MESPLEEEEEEEEFVTPRMEEQEAGLRRSPRIKARQRQAAQGGATPVAARARTVEPEGLEGFTPPGIEGQQEYLAKYARPQQGEEETEPEEEETGLRRSTRTTRKPDYYQA